MYNILHEQNQRLDPKSIALKTVLSGMECCRGSLDKLERVATSKRIGG
jgi:hypothetical protein